MAKKRGYHSVRNEVTKRALPSKGASPDKAPRLARRLIQIATDVLLHEGALAHVDRSWIDARVNLPSSTYNDDDPYT
jgi:hypothetical protein